MATKAVILCGGQGTRIREASEVIPKPMLPIGNMPIVWHIMKGFAAHGVREFVLCLGYKGWIIKEYFLNYRAKTVDVTVRLGREAAVVCHDHDGEEDWVVTLAETGEDTMTGSRVAAVRRYVESDEPFLLTYGDGVSDVDVRELLAYHRRHGKVVTVTAVRPPGRFGEMDIDGVNVKAFNEKPQASEGYINGGFLVCDGRRTWDYLERGQDVVLEREPMQRLAREGQLAAYRHGGFWYAMDTLREYHFLNDLWATGHAPWKTWPDRAP